MIVRIIEKEATYPLRHAVLRTGKPPETCYFQEDHLAGSFHLGAFSEHQLIGIASFYPKSCPSVADNNAFQLRGMATAPKYRGQHAGSKLILHGVQLLQQKEVETLWCNARENYCSFYERFGFVRHGEVFRIEGIGRHQKMTLQNFPKVLELSESFLKYSD